jgi:hypothetical protein
MMGNKIAAHLTGSIVEEKKRRSVSYHWGGVGIRMWRLFIVHTTERFLGFNLDA